MTSRALTCLGFAACVLAACAVDDGTNPSPIDNRVYVDAGKGRDSGSDDADGGSFALQPFTPPPADPGAKSVLFSASGEVLALGGYGFPPAGDAPAFVDGWEVQFTRVLVTLDRLTLSENPDKVPSDPSKTDGVVVEVDGPFAVDLHAGGSLVGKGGTDERAVPIASASADLDPTKRYAFGFATVVASSSARNVNLDGAALGDYQEMIAKGYAVYYVGTATFRGGSDCSTKDASYDFGKLPKTVHFKLGFKSPTTYLNCQNPDADPAKPFEGEEHQRGIQVDATRFVVAQVTIHTDHPFWESVVHDSPAHFDQFAARKLGSAEATVTMEDVIGVDPTHITGGDGVGLPWRSCLPTYPAKSGTMSFDSQSIPVDPSKPPNLAFRDLADFVTYDQSTQGHLNSDGLCAIRHDYPSP